MTGTTLENSPFREASQSSNRVHSNPGFAVTRAEARLLRKPRILIVEDEPDVAKSLALRLSAARYEVQVACDGMEATRAAVTTLPDLILLDIGLPCGDGHEVAERLQQNPRTMTIPIIYLTARTSDYDRHKAFTNAAFGFVTKPFKSERLLALIEEALEANSR